jgi:hypothetical protein
MLRNIQIEESGWNLIINDNLITIGDAVSGGTRGSILFNKTDIRAFKVLFKKFDILTKAENHDFDDSELFDDDTPLDQQIKDSKIKKQIKEAMN